MKRYVLPVLVALLLAPPTFGASRIRLEVESDNNCRELTLQPGVPVRGWIVATVESGDAAIAGAEFAIRGVDPQSVLVAVNPNPAVASATGDPFGAGARVVYSRCSDDQSLYLYDVLFYSFGVTQIPITFAGLGSSECPSVLGCDLVPSCAFGGLQPAPGNTVLLSPANGATDVPLDVELVFRGDVAGAYCCGGVPWWAIAFGTDPDPPDVYGTVEDPWRYSPGPLAPHTTYYWRVRSGTCVSTSTSQLWNFTTGARVAVQRTGWSAVKTLFR